MSVFAAVMTGKGTGAISTVQVFGDSAKPGAICLGTISDGVETIDQVTIGCETAHSFAINCHGNPLIVEMVMQLLQRHGATLLTAEELLTKILSAEKFANTIILEAKLAQPKAQTIGGTKIIANQIDAGLSSKAAEWLQNINAISLDEISSHAERILETSQTAKLIINGCTARETGSAPNAKSVHSPWSWLTQQDWMKSLQQPLKILSKKPLSKKVCRF